MPTEAETRESSRWKPSRDTHELIDGRKPVGVRIWTTGSWNAPATGVVIAFADRGEVAFKAPEGQTLTVEERNAD